LPAEVRPIRWRAGRLLLLDQRKLPGREVYVSCRSARETARAIRGMVVRGAPAIGVAAAYGLAVEARRFRPGKLSADFERAAKVLAQARPTAVNLSWAISRLRAVLSDLAPDSSAAAVARRLEQEAQAILEEDVAVNRSIGRHGASLLAHGDVLTHCNAGALATAGYGTALGVIRAAWDAGRRFGVYATETRPYLQGMRLTAWELAKLRIPVTLVTDSMTGHLFQSGRIAAVVVGTDRTAANGDVANKIGTYPIAVLARLHGVPFYVAAPTSSIDLDCPDGARVPIEQRSEEEITHLDGRRLAPAGVRALNPAFDVTPAELVTAIITEHGIVRGDYRRGLERMVTKARRSGGVSSR
jgi:methylthioribose-1-phosphate isomerase